MRAREFLIEYDRNKTTQNLGRQLADAFMTGGDKRQYEFYNTTYQHPDGTPDMAVVLTQVMSSLEEADPTKNKIYTPWLAREYAKQNIKRLEDAHVLNPMLANYDKYKKRNDFRADAKDIMRLSYGQFYTIMSNYEPPPDPVKDKGKAREVYKTNEVRVIIPDDQQAACYYGQGTRWCTAATRGPNYFSRYSSPDRPLYILLPTSPNYDGEKYQLHFGSDQFMNEEDEPINLYELITERFPNLYRFFIEREPAIKEMIPFTDDSLLESIGTQISEITMDRVWEKITDWELEDDSFKDWQLISAEKMGIINDEMSDEEIWDTIRENTKLNDYLDYNDEARRFMIDIRESVKITPEKMKEIAIGMMEDPNLGEPIHYYNLSVVYANNIEDYFGIGRYKGWSARGQEDGGMAEWVREHISISKNGYVSYVR